MLMVTYNIQFGRGRDGRTDLDRIARTVGGADIIALQEVERNWRVQDHADQAARLGELLPAHRWTYGPSMDLDGSGVGPDGRVRNGRRQFGNMILSRLPIVSSRVHQLPTIPVSGHVDGPCTALEAVIQDGDLALRVYNTHLSHLLRRQRLMQIEALWRCIAQSTAGGGMVTAPNVDLAALPDDWMVLPGGRLPAMPDAIILAGDFNAEVATPEYEAIVGSMDPLYGRMIEADRFVDGLTLAGVPEGSGVTFPASAQEPAMRLDHVFVSMQLANRVRHGWIDEAADGSDHQPVWVELSL